MFETSVVCVQARPVSSRFSLLTASIIAHTSIVAGAIALSIATVDFPGVAPDEFALAPVFAQLQIPPPLGTPDGGRPAQQQQPAHQPPIRPNEVTAPAQVPETVTPAEASGIGDTPVTGAGTGIGPVGVPWGVEGSIGDPDAPPVVDVPAQPQPEERVYQPHEVQAPVLIHRVEPRYPASLIRTGMSETVVVRCVIDRSGRVRDAAVVDPGMPPFNAEVLRVVSQWRYKPATFAGKAVDSYLDLTVHFSVMR
jgi:protein TonB